MKIAGVLLILTCKCDQAMPLHSDSLDRPLSFSERWALRLHQLVCSNCRRVSRQLQWLHGTLARIPVEVRERLYLRACMLLPETKSRIKQRLREI